MTLSDLLIDCCTRLNYPPDLTVADPKVLARLTAFLNQTQFEIFGQPSYKGLLKIETPLQTVPGKAAYGLPIHIDRITAITDPTREVRLGMISTDAYRRYLPDPTRQTGNPLQYAFDGWSSVQFQPDAGSDVFVFSTPADNGTTISCMAVTKGGIGSPNSDIWLRHTAVLDSTAPAGVLLVPAVGGYISDLEVEKPVVAGTVDVIQGNPAQFFIARIPHGQSRGRYAQLYLAPTPSGAFTLTVFGERHVIPLVDLGDSSAIPLRFHYLLAAGARMKEYELRGDTTRYGIARREYDGALAFLNSWVSTQPDGADVMVPDDHRSGGTSVLGPWFPASSYR
jgi:hypothetical protein